MTTGQPIMDSTFNNSLLGMITAMQNTISSLQATMTQLMTEKVNKCEQPSVNMLEKIYGKETTIPATTTASQFGVPADSLPHVDIISETLKRNIIEGVPRNCLTSRSVSAAMPTSRTDHMGQDKLKDNVSELWNKAVGERTMTVYNTGQEMTLPRQGSQLC